MPSFIVIVNNTPSLTSHLALLHNLGVIFDCSSSFYFCWFFDLDFLLHLEILLQHCSNIVPKPEEKVILFLNRTDFRCTFKPTFSYAPSGLSSIPALKCVFRWLEQGSLWWHGTKDAGCQSLIVSPGFLFVRWLCAGFGCAFCTL